MRHAMGATNWRSVGLGLLDDINVPFSTIPMTDSYPLPKIAGNAHGSAADASNFLTTVHRHQSNVDRHVLSPSQLTDLFQSMHIGQYYQFLPKSRCADAVIRCDDRTVVQFQFKNWVTPITPDELRAEVSKCEISNGWVSYLVVMCSMGYAGPTASEDLVQDMAGMKVIVLSKASMERWIGAHALSQLAQPVEAPLLTDAIRRLSVTTPLKCIKNVDRE